MEQIPLKSSNLSPGGLQSHRALRTFVCSAFSSKSFPIFSQRGSGVNSDAGRFPKRGERSRALAQPDRPPLGFSQLVLLNEHLFQSEPWEGDKGWL